MKLAFFGDSTSFISAILFRELTEILRGNRDISLVAVVDASRRKGLSKPLYAGYSGALFKYLVKRFFNPNKKISLDYYGNFVNLASKISSGELIIFPRVDNISDPYFVTRLKSCSPDVALSVACPQKFQKELLDIFTYCINYHDSLLPRYRGTNSTKFSLYYGEKITGYTFHFMDEKFDSGDILVQGYIPIDYDSIVDHNSVVQLQIRKTMEAGKRLSKVIACLLNNEKGIPQRGDKSYFGNKELNELITVRDLASVDPKEIQRRLTIFGHIKTCLRGKTVYVTDVQVSRGYLEIKRIYYLPVWIWQIWEFVRKYRKR